MATITGFRSRCSSIVSTRAGLRTSIPAGRSEPVWRILTAPSDLFSLIFGFFRNTRCAVHRAPLGWAERFRCYLYLLNWVRSNVFLLCGDLTFAFGELTKSRSRPRLAKTLGTKRCRL